MAQNHYREAKFQKENEDSIESQAEFNQLYQRMVTNEGERIYSEQVLIPDTNEIQYSNGLSNGKN